MRQNESSASYRLEGPRPRAVLVLVVFGVLVEVGGVVSGDLLCVVVVGVEGVVVVGFLVEVEAKALSVFTFVVWGLVKVLPYRFLK